MLVKRKLPTLIADSPLIWLPETGIGYSPVEPIEYGEDYWNNYRKLDRGVLAGPLNDFRADFVSYWFPDQWDQVVDVGIGGGVFVERTGCRGLDINPHAVVWLKERDAWGPGPNGVGAMTFWDSFEHIPDHDGHVKAPWLFMSLPIFDDAAHVLRSKHFKPGEHIWYFTESGLIRYMAGYGYQLKDKAANETQIGREGIMTYAFHRLNHPKEA